MSMRAWLGFLVLALLVAGCGSNPGDELIRVSSSKMQVDILAMGRIVDKNPEAVKYANSDGTTALHAACKVWNYVAVGRLVGAGADVNARDKLGNTPLHYALGAIEAQNQGASKGMPGTPLTAEQKVARNNVQAGVTFAQENDRDDIVKFLLKSKADATIKNNEGKTPPEFSSQSQKVYEYAVRRVEGGR